MNKIKINQDIAELTGIILGDGHIHTKHNLITIVGSLEDLGYYKERVIPLFQKVFDKTVKIRKRNDRNAYYLLIYSKEIIDFFINCVGLKRGSKVKAFIPKIIFSDKKLIKSFFRGLFDTDGCIKFSKQTKSINYYPRVQIALRFSPLAEELSCLFHSTGFPYGTWKDNRFSGMIFYQVSGKKNTIRWFKEISPKNMVHRSKYDFWKKFGYYIPKSSLKFRIDELNKTKIL